MPRVLLHDVAVPCGSTCLRQPNVAFWRKGDCDLIFDDKGTSPVEIDTTCMETRRVELPGAARSSHQSLTKLLSMMLAKVFLDSFAHGCVGMAPLLPEQLFGGRAILG